MISFFRHRRPSHKFQKLDDSNNNMDSPGEMIATPTLKLTRASSYEYDSGSSSTNSASRGGGITHCIGGAGSGSNSSKELIYDQLCNMIAQEERDGYKCCDYLSYYPGRSSSENNKSKSSKSIDESCRTSICGWMYRVADHFAIDREGELLRVYMYYMYTTCGVSSCS